MDDCLERTESMISMTKLQSSSSSSEQEEQVHGGDQESGGGLINQLMSYLPGLESNGNGGGELKNLVTTDHSTAVVAEKTKEEEQNGGGGLMGQFINNLPSVSVPVSIPDGPAPDSEEASLLIHIVQD